MADPWPALALLSASAFLGASVVTLLWVLRCPLPAPASSHSEPSHDAASFGR